MAEDQATATSEIFLRTVFSQLKWYETPEMFHRILFSQLKWCENTENFLRRPLFGRDRQNRSSYRSSRKKATSSRSTRLPTVTAVTDHNGPAEGSVTTPPEPPLTKRTSRWCTTDAYNSHLSDPRASCAWCAACNTSLPYLD